MQLVLTTRDPYNANYCTPEGQVIYKVVSPFQLVNRKATIDKVVPSDAEDLQDHFERIGEVEYHLITPSVITFNGVRQGVDKFFKKKTALLNLGSDRIFTGPDGKEYRWKVANTKPVLYTNDDTDTKVAKFHQKDLIAITPKASPAILEIFPADPHNADYCNPEGQVVYQVLSSFRILHRRRATIDKVIPTHTGGAPNQLERIGEVEFHFFNPSIVTFNNASQTVDQLFRKSLTLLGLGSNRIFTGPDGKEYRWKLGNTRPVLYTNDDTNTEVAKFHPADLLTTLSGQPVTLEIFPPGEHMMDFIIVTFVYIEKLRRDRRRSRRRRAGD
ncbi:hypothetical protein NMY22_g9105 [Coprinellus aureogranulatus]|nr:hypothetical protein NMY22_g9105 [Coprinellus aureogranulatus]